MPLVAVISVLKAMSKVGYYYSMVVAKHLLLLFYFTRLFNLNAVQRNTVMSLWNPPKGSFYKRQFVRTSH